MNIGMLNPARHLVGRLFLWFWLTALATAGIAVWISKLTDDTIEIGSITPRHSQMLAQLSQRLERTPIMGSTLPRKLSRLSQKLPLQLVAVAVDTGEIVRSDNSPLPPPAQKHLLNVVTQQAPIVIKQRNFLLIGPQAFVYQSRPYVLFLAERGPPIKPQKLLIGIISVGVVVSMLLSYWFARTLVRPIQQLRQASKKLAEGDWQARAHEPTKRSDELGMLARDFNNMATQLELLWRGQKRLLGDISHELRSPLTRLQMALGLAHQQNINLPTLKRIEREADRMEDLIGQLLTLTHAEAAPAKMQRVTMIDLFDNLCQDTQFEAQNSGKSFEYSDLPDQVISANPALLCSAVENVLRNAIRYAKSQVWMWVTIEHNGWQVVVEDDGPGLSADDQRQIFAPFYRASLARDRSSGGVGLGLAIARAAVSAHQGLIQAGSRDSGGLRITLYFPSKSQAD